MKVLIGKPGPNVVLHIVFGSSGWIKELTAFHDVLGRNNATTFVQVVLADL